MRKINIELKKYKKRDLILPASIMGALLVVIFIVVQLIGRAERITVDEPLYQFQFEEADSYPEGITMKKSEESILVDNGIQTYESDGRPFYYKESPKMILSDDFLYLDRSGAVRGRLPYFTEIEKTEEGYVPKGRQDIRFKGGMLHDGRDVYIFLEDTEITYNGKTKQIHGFSYVVCYMGESILICNYGENAIFEELDEKKASAFMENGIEVDLVNDIYYRANGTKHLLFSEPDVFEMVQ